MRSSKYWLVVFGCILFSACRTNKKTVDNKTGVDPSELVEVAVKLPHPPIAVMGGIQIKQLFSGEPNTIKVYTEDGNTSLLDVSATSGDIKPIDLTKGLYSYYSKSSNILVEIVARDTINNVVVAGSFELVTYPAPKAVIWDYRKAMPGNKQRTYNAEEFRQRTAVILYHDYNIPVRCNARSFILTRVALDGQRSTHLNETDTGEFDAESKAMVQAAQKGDIYLVQDVKTKCSNKIISDIVYVIE